MDRKSATAYIVGELNHVDSIVAIVAEPSQQAPQQKKRQREEVVEDVTEATAEMAKFLAREGDAGNWSDHPSLQLTLKLYETNR